VTNPLYIVLVSPHGLIRGHEPELGRDPDTGGQVLYVLELARALARHPGVERVDLLTRCVQDPKVAPDYGRAEEPLCEGARIVRIACGPRRYLRKEALWPHLDGFADNALLHFRRVGRVPDLIHGHYADGGYAGARLAQLLGTPLVHTGHSLGRVKRERLRAGGTGETALESRYNISRRIEAEEIALGNALLVVASTTQEIDEQYSQYENYHPKRMRVIPPGVDLARFHPARRNEPRPPIADELDRFLREPRKPMVLALSRADERKNISTLIEAYAGNRRLRESANLVIVAGNRDNLLDMDKGQAEVLSGILHAVDRYDLYGRAAYPKHHEPDDVPALYRLAARTRGVFVNPALTEPFGLTLLEAAASGLPVVTTNDGGPRDILKHCRNGLLIDPLDPDAMGNAIGKAIDDRARWTRWSRSGIRGVADHYTWEAHVRKYLHEVRRVLGGPGRLRLGPKASSRLPAIERMVVCDIDNTLLGDNEGLGALAQAMHEAPLKLAFAIATGRGIDSARQILREWDAPQPDVLITSVGAEIYYGHNLAPDEGWERHLDYRWDSPALREALEGIPGIRLQPRSEQRRFKLSYYVEPDRWPGVAAVRRHLRKLDLRAKVIYSHGAFLDLLPIRASKGLAVRYLAIKWGISPDALLVCGDSGNDEEMLSGNTLGVVVGNYSKELEKLRDQERVYFARSPYAWGILEGLQYYDFLTPGPTRAGD